MVLILHQVVMLGLMGILIKQIIAMLLYREELVIVFAILCCLLLLAEKITV